MTEAEKEEEFAQKEYEELMSDSAEKRAKDSKAVDIKAQSKADEEQMLTKEEGESFSTTEELMAVKEYQNQIHADCDWLIQNFNLRKEARSDEIENLQKAKAVLAGADFSLMQKAPKRSNSTSGTPILSRQRRSA